MIKKRVCFWTVFIFTSVERAGNMARLWIASPSGAARLVWEFISESGKVQSADVLRLVQFSWREDDVLNAPLGNWVIAPRKHLTPPKFEVFMKNFFASESENSFIQLNKLQAWFLFDRTHQPHIYKKHSGRSNFFISQHSRQLLTHGSLLP